MRDFRDMESEARYWLRLVMHRKEMHESRQGGGSTLRSAMLQAGCEIANSAGPASDLQDWYLTVECVLRAVGKRDAFIMGKRLLSRPKSAESSWEQIGKASGVGSRNARDIYRSAVERFLIGVHAKGLTVNHHEMPREFESLAS